MALQILFLIVGLILILLGANSLVEGSSNLARRFGISEFMIGLTIVGMGTSAPEMVVSFMSAMKGSSDLAIGNIVGSNIFNTCLAIGLIALISPLTITRSNFKRDIPMNLLATAMLLLLGKTLGNDGLSRIDGIILIITYALYIYVSIKKDSAQNVPSAGEMHPAPQQKLISSVSYIIAGLAGLILGGRMMVNAAVEIAQSMGISEKFIAVTILAGGTSFPELATGVVAAIKGKGQLALGNVLGSNIGNILLILGGSSLICPLSADSISVLDMILLLGGALLFVISAFSFKKNEIDRYEGIIFLTAYITYLGILISKI